MGTREPRLQLGLQQALAGTAQPSLAGMLCASGVLICKQPCRPLGAQSSRGAEQMSKVAFERWAQLCGPRLLYFQFLVRGVFSGLRICGKIKTRSPLLTDVCNKGPFSSPWRRRWWLQEAGPRPSTYCPAGFLSLVYSCSPAPARNTLTEFLHWTRMFMPQ